MTDLTAYRASKQTACAQTVEGHLFNDDYRCQRCKLSVSA